MDIAPLFRIYPTGNNTSCMKIITIRNLDHPIEPPIKAKYCASFYCRLRGLMLKRILQPGEGLLLVNKSDDKINATIHMLFMRFDICVVWINQARQVVDIQHAHRWGLAFIPRTPACYILELNTNHINDFHIGDRVQFDDTPVSD